MGWPPDLHDRSGARYHSGVPDVTVALLQERVLDPEQIARALAAAKRGDVASSALQMGLAAEAALVRALALAYGCPGIDLSRSVVPAANLVVVPVALCRRHGMLPVSIGQAGVALAMADPGDRQAIVAVRLRTGRQVLPHVAVRAAIEDVLAAVERAGSKPAKAWRGARAPALPDPAAPWVGVVKPPAPPHGIDLPAVDAPMELMSIAEAMDEAASAVSAAPDPAAEAPPGAAPRASPPSIESPSDAPAVPPPRAPLPPAAEVPAMPAPPPREQPAPALGAGAAGAPVRLALVADDDPEVRQLLAKILEDLGCAVVVAGDGREALRMVRELRPRLVVLDAMMPEIHGFEVCSAIKSDRELRVTPVVLCSAVYRGSAGADARVAFGADAYLEKPFRLETVTQLFRHWLASGGVGAADRERREAAERHWRAGAEELAKGQIDEALHLCWRAVDEDQFSPQAHYCLGHALSQQGMLYEAVAAFERAAELEPAAEASHQCLALLYERLGFQRSAREAWAHAIEASRDPARKKVMQARLAGLLFL